MTDTREAGGQGSTPAGSQVFGELLGNRDIRQVFGQMLTEVGRRDRRVVVLDCQTAIPTMAITFARACRRTDTSSGLVERPCCGKAGTSP